MTIIIDASLKFNSRVFPFSRNWKKRMGLFAEFLDNFLERFLGRALRKLSIVLITMKC